MAFKRLYYDVAVHGGAAATYHNLNQGSTFIGQVLDNGSSFIYVPAGMIWPATNGFMCFGTQTDGALFDCRLYSELATNAIFGVALPVRSSYPWRMPTTAEPWVAYTSDPLTSGVVEIYFQYHRR